MRLNDFLETWFPGSPLKSLTNTEKKCHSLEAVMGNVEAVEGNV